MPALLLTPAPAPAVADPADARSCVLHGDIHPLGPDCRAYARAWKAARSHLQEPEMQDAYEAAAERQMLDSFIRGEQIFTAVKI